MRALQHRAAVVVCGLFVLLAFTHTGYAAGGEVAPINWTDTDFKSKDIHGEPLSEEPGAHQETMGPPVLLALINFGLLLLLLFWKAVPPLRRFAVARSDRIRDALEEGQRLREQAQAKLEEYTTRIAGVEAEVQTMIDQIKADAESEKQRIVEHAKAQAAAIKRDAEQRIAAEIDRARTLLEAEVIASATAAAETLLRKNTTSADHQTLVDDFIRNVTAADAPRAEGPV